MISFIDDHRGSHGVEPICRVLPIAPSTYHDHVAKRTEPEKLSARAKRDEILKSEIARVFAENFEVYGARKGCLELKREKVRDVARCTVERLMRGMGLRGVIRGKHVKTTFSDKTSACPAPPLKLQAPCASTEPAVAVGLHLCRFVVRDLFTSPSSSMPLPGASSAGRQAVLPMPALCSMHWSRHFITEDRRKT